jgi:glycosyl transferase, family 25
MDEIHKVVYINLKERTDRNEQVQNELQKYFPTEKIIRFEAIRNVRGNVGCTQSHIQVVKMAMDHNWPNVLIVEDDLQWINGDTKQLSQFFTKSWDVILFGAAHVKFGFENRCIHAQTTTAYCVSKH